MRHWTKSGIFAMWGEHDWRKYHWLSHGWGGLLNQLGGQPETFTTLTRVMPFAYSAAFAASILVLKKLLSRNTTSTLLFSVSSWGVVGVSRLDWSATSTGGAIAFVSAAITVGVLTLAERCSFSTRLVTSTLLLTFAAITKFPSVFLLFIFFFALEVFNFFRHCRVKRLTTFILSYTTLGLPALVTLVFISSTLVDGFSIAPVNRELGEIKTLEIPFAFIFVMLSKLWLIIPLLLLLLSQWRSNSELRNSTPSSFILAMTPLFLGGIFFDVAISAVNSNGHEYFSGPFYFLASLSLLLWVEPYWELHTSKALRLCTLMVSSFFVLTSFLTQHLQVPTKLTEYFSSKLSGVKNRSSLLIFVLSDIRLAASISALTLVLLGTFIHRRNILGVVSSLLVALVVLTFCSYLPVTLKTFSQARDETEIGSLYGNQDLQKIGAWLKTATNESDFIATNYLQNRRGELISDYSLAVWSERTFFVLGPKFFSDNSSQIVATAISKRFAETASKQNANKLWDAGVRWFVIDTALVIRDNWLESADEKYRTGRFVILRLRDPT